MLTFSAVPNGTTPFGLETLSYRFSPPGANLHGISWELAWVIPRLESIVAIESSLIALEA